MNRLVLIGNGFDLAHGLKTKYEHFIDWYWEQKINEFIHELTDTLQDKLCTFKLSGGKFWVHTLCLSLGVIIGQQAKRLFNI